MHQSYHSIPVFMYTTTQLFTKYQSLVLKDAEVPEHAS